MKGINSRLCDREYWGNENLFRLNEQEKKKNLVQNLEKKEQQLQIFPRLVCFRN